MTWVKICAMTNPEDAHAAVAAGADAIGLIFCPSKRRITPGQAAQITADLPSHVERVGVFVNEAPEVICQTIRAAKLTTVQLQGDEDANYVSQLFATHDRVLGGEKKRIIKTISVGPMLEDKLREFSSRDAGVDAVLFDSGNAQERGGTGRVFPWARVAAILDNLTTDPRIIVAGGLTPNNVADAIQALSPWGVDVASGTESAPGKKDPAKMKAFVAAVRAAERNG